MTESKENIFLFIPNLIGYARIILALISFYFMPFNYIVAVSCYVISALLDAVDGHAARHYNQSTKFGAMLDQLTDRCGTTGLLITLSNFYPKYMFFFQISVTIDIACHWLYLHSQQLRGRSSHKFQDVTDNKIMALYYQKGPLLFMCMTNEAFYASLYLLYFAEGPMIAGLGLFRMVALATGPFAVLKAIISLIHAYVASLNIAGIDALERQKIEKSQ
ncbi:CDP-diacylglycerol--inositol 3-phosphatidyltransferase [Halyomorpha halys]|uniref:CDP-diacylglycerol--inositol 3-phosphatidyltransferase n=1 Tax=Halyomorpha halys TaxID=286706 RepID=UPI0006D51096|nr:CDP-diacylglycerol--inositol 3-phosphatidyltransferase [Halyomorpha halys]